MKLALCTSVVALVTGSAALASGVQDPTFNAINWTESAVSTRHLSGGGIYRMVGVDIVGKDITNANARTSTAFECFNNCLAQLYSAPGKICSASTWTNGGACWPKVTSLTGTPTTPKADAESFIVLGDATSQFIWSGTKDGVDMAGYDIDNKLSATMGKCFEACNANNKCFAVTWTDYNGGTCWLKSRASGFVPKAGAKSAYVAREFNGPQ